MRWRSCRSSAGDPVSDGLKIVYDFSDLEASLAELIARTEKRRPLMGTLAAHMAYAVEENFLRQGRPEWQGWSPQYARQRAGGKILQKSGRLAKSIVQQSDNHSATVGTNVRYARIHQEGGTINIAARSQRSYHRQRRDGSVDNRFARKSRANFAQWNTIGAYKITMPARPFLQLSEEDVERMEETAQRYLQDLIK